MNDAPMWLQASLVSFILGGFILALLLGMWVIDTFSSLRRVLERLLGDE